MLIFYSQLRFALLASLFYATLSESLKLQVIGQLTQMGQICIFCIFQAEFVKRKIHPKNVLPKPKFRIESQQTRCNLWNAHMNNFKKINKIVGFYSFHFIYSRKSEQYIENRFEVFFERQKLSSADFVVG